MLHRSLYGGVFACPTRNSLTFTCGLSLPAYRMLVTTISSQSRQEITMPTNNGPMPPPPPNPYTGGHANPASNKETKATPLSNIAKPIAVTFGVFAASLLPKKEHSREPLQQPTNPPKQKRPLKNPINPGFRQKTRMHFKARGIIYNYCAKCNI